MKKEYKVVEIKKDPSRKGKTLDINENNTRKKFKRIFFWSLFFFPAIVSAFIISYHSNYLFRKPFDTILLILSAFLFINLIASFILKIKYRHEPLKKKNIFIKIITFLFFTIYISGAAFCLYVFYRPVEEFKTWLVTTAMTTLKHQYLARIFYSDYEIRQVLNRNKIVEIKENTDGNLIQFQKEQPQVFESEEERFILERKKGEHYKIVNIEENTAMGKMRGKMIVVYDPSKIFIGVSKYLGTAGQTVTDIVRNYDGAVGINGGGFIDPNWTSNGAKPHGIVISKGKLIANNVKASVGGGLVGLDKDGKLILGRYTPDQALKLGIRDAVEFGPFLIVNGKSSFIQGNGGWGWAPRTVVAQRADGVALLLTVDGRQPGWSMGAGMQELTRLMLKYKAVNAACMDGGTSTVMANQEGALNRPSNGSRLVVRRIPNAWIVAK